MSLEPTSSPTLVTAVQNITDQVRRTVDSAQRGATYAQASAAGEIGLDFEEIKVLIDRLLRDLDALPSDDAVGTATGASAYESAVFAHELKKTVAAARAATKVMRDQVDEVAKAVHLTITELSDSDAEARQTLAATDGVVEDLAAEAGSSSTSTQSANVQAAQQSAPAADASTVASSGWGNNA